LYANEFAKILNMPPPTDLLLLTNTHTHTHTQQIYAACTQQHYLRISPRKLTRLFTFLRTHSDVRVTLHEV